MAFVKLILAHERQENLIKSFEAYLQVFKEVSSAKPDTIVIIDSSSVVNHHIQSLKFPWLIYMHTPSLSMSSKINLFVSEFSPGPRDRIDLCSDEDLYFREDFTAETPYSFQLDSCFAWRLLESSTALENNLLCLRDMSRICGGLAVNISEIDRYQLLCKFSHPEGYWSLMSGDLFLLRNSMLSFMRKILPEKSSKIDEIFLNVLHSFAVSTECKKSIRFRNTDNSKSLRFTSNSNSDSAMKASFSSIYTFLSKNNASEFKECLSFLCASINNMLKLRGSFLKVEPYFIDSLIRLSINSYSSALSYDFNNRSYVFSSNSIYINDELEAIDAYRFDALSSSRRLFDSLSSPSLMFSSGMCKDFFLFSDCGSPFAFGRNCEIFASIPKSYWGF